MTRPEPDASLSAERLRALGHDVIISPLLEVKFSDAPLSWEANTEIIVTSKNGVRALASLAHETMRVHAPIIAVGDATAALAKQAGFANVFSASGTTEDLVALIADKKPNKLLYICGRDRKSNLEEKLHTLGIPLNIAERYHADFVKVLHEETQKALINQSIDGILFYSARSAQAFQKLIDQNLVSYMTNTMTYFCLAKDVSSVFDSSCGIEIAIANHPTEQSLFEAIQTYKQNCAN